MMYSNNFAVAIKVNGKVLRESGDSVSLPFGCEYSVFIKNLNSVRGQIQIAIDGEDVAGKIIIRPNSSLELERFIRSGNLESGNRFRFIERTESVEAHRGVRIDDGLVRIEAWKERVYVRPIVAEPPGSDSPPFPPELGDLSAFFALSSSPGTTANSDASGRTAPGITVPGSESRQRFVTAQGFPLEDQSTVMVLRLVGCVGAVPIEQPVTVDIKPGCSTCGKKNRATNKFCDQCGTALVLI
jgi:hypothetical protein